jgi:hypothetical protein
VRASGGRACPPLPAWGEVPLPVRCGSCRLVVRHDGSRVATCAACSSVVSGVTAQAWRLNSLDDRGRYRFHTPHRCFVGVTVAQSPGCSGDGGNHEPGQAVRSSIWTGRSSKQSMPMGQPVARGFFPRAVKRSRWLPSLSAGADVDGAADIDGLPVDRLGLGRCQLCVPPPRACLPVRLPTPGVRHPRAGGGSHGRPQVRERRPATCAALHRGRCVPSLA